MQRLDIVILLILLLQACKGSGQTTAKDEKAKADTKYSIQLINENLIVKSCDSVIIYNSNKLIRNFDLVDTSFYKGNGNDFFLVYQNYASTTKTQSTYHLFYNKNDLYLISKEKINLKEKKISISKNYTIPLKVTDLDYEAIDEKNVIENYKSSILSESRLRNNVSFNNKNAFELIFNYEPNDFFIDYPLNLFKIGTINIQDIKNSNDIAYYLLEAKIYDESIFILKNIIKKDPKRVVAYLNLADSYWETGNVCLAKKNYTIYVSMMKNQRKDLSKIPVRAYERSK